MTAANSGQHMLLAADDDVAGFISMNDWGAGAMLHVLKGGGHCCTSRS